MKNDMFGGPCDTKLCSTQSNIEHVFMRPYVVLILLSPTLLITYILLTLWLSSKKQPQSYDCTHLCPYTSNLTRTHLEFDSKYLIRHYADFICQPNFRNLADWVYGWPDQFNEYVQVTTINGRDIAPCLLHGSIIYVSIWSIDKFFAEIYPELINSFVLITGEGDVSSPNMDYLEGENSKIIHWFGQNGQIDASKSKKFTHIPIGIQCYEMAEAINSILKQQNNHTLHYVQQTLIKTQDFDRKKLLLINFNQDTDGTGLRRRIWNDMCSFKNRIPFVTCLRKSSGVGPSNLPNIYSRNRQYSFWLSPRGNGLDCHRTWEALYLDVIPIVWNSSLNILYENLPIIIIQNHTDLTETFLREKFHEISTKKYQQLYRFDKLGDAYWHRLILSKSRHSSLKNNNLRTNQCWRARRFSLFS